VTVPSAPRRPLVAAPRRRGRRVLLAGAVALPVLLLATLALVVANPGVYEVLEQGRLLSYSTGDVYHVRVLHTFELYVDAESAHPPRIDILNSLVLAAAMGGALAVALLLPTARQPLSPRVAQFFPTLAAGAALLAADDLGGIHETLGHNLRWLADLPGVDQPDDVVLALYALPVLALAVYYRHLLTASRALVLALALGLASFGGAVLLDIVTDLRGEELLEIDASFFVLMLVLGVARTYLRVEPARLDDDEG
jgi:hypothetical protein